MSAGARRDEITQVMFIDLTKFSEAELLDLNRRSVERLRLMRSARQLVELAHFTVGMRVAFTTDDGRGRWKANHPIESQDGDCLLQSVRTLAGQPDAPAAGRAQHDPVGRAVRTRSSNAMKATRPVNRPSPA